MNSYQEKIYNHLLDSIMTGDLAVNERIPTETELGKMFKTNRMNAHLAVKKLENFGILRRNKRQGTFVCKKPNAITTGELKSINTRRICVLNHNQPRISEIHWNDRISNSFEKVIQANKTEMIYKSVSSFYSYEKFSDYIKGITEEGYNALVLVGDSFIDNITQEHPEILFKFHNSVFMFNRGTAILHDWPYNIVSVNLFGEGIIAADYLLEQGYEKIIFAKSSKTYWTKERERGLQFGLMRETDHQMQAEVFDLPIEFEGSIFDEVKNYEEKYVIVAANDEIAVRIFDAAKEQGLTPGKDFGLMGFDDNSKYREYNLTTVSPPLEQIGVKLADMVIKKLDGKDNGEIANIRIDSELVIRNTC